MRLNLDLKSIMKEQFYEFYKLPTKKVHEIWDKGLLIVDTNVLLDLYRLGSKSREDLKKSIDFFKDRIWLPYQAGLEFHRNRKSVINELGGSKYDEFIKTLNDIVVPKVKESFKTFQRHPCIDYSYIEKGIEKFKKDLEKKALEWKKEYPFDVDNDDVLDWVTAKFDGKVGEEFSTKELLDIYNEGSVRYKAEVPPGYKDANDKDKKEAGQKYVYGDLIIWKSVIQKAKKDKIDVVFLTNDNKEDWYERYKGQAKGPRFELFREFHKETGQDIIIMSEATFLKEMKDKNSVKVKDSSIEDALRALEPKYSFGWYNPVKFTWPLIQSSEGGSLQNGILDIPIISDGVKPSVPYNIYDDALMMIDPTTGLINFRKLSEPLQNPYIKFIKDEDDKKDENK